MRRWVFSGLAVTLMCMAAPSASFGAADHVPGQVVVKFTDGTSAQQQETALGAGGVSRVLSTIRGTGGAKVTLTTIGVQAAIDRLERSSVVEYAEPNFIYRATAVPNDPMFGQMWGLDNAGQTGGTPDADIDAPEGWDAFGLSAFPATGGAKVGIVDTGIQRSHPDLAGKTVNCAGVNDFGVSLVVLIINADPTIAEGRCEDDHGHGTHVAGTVAANTNNGVGVAGVAFNSPLAICKGLNGSGAGTLEMIANCIDWTSDQDVDVISMSLGGSGGSQTLQTAVRNATDNGALVIAAAGNGGNSTVQYPAGYAEVVSVAATDRNDQKASFSTFNNDVEVAAPGVDIVSTWTGSSYDTISGTSMATPHAAGVAALIAGANPTGGPAAWRATLNAAVDDLGTPGRDPQFGFGRVNLALAAP